MMTEYGAIQLLSTSLQQCIDMLEKLREEPDLFPAKHVALTNARKVLLVTKDFEERGWRRLAHKLARELDHALGHVEEMGCTCQDRSKGHQRGCVGIRQAGGSGKLLKGAFR